MLPLPPEKIKEIADMVDSGFRCMVHKQTGELLYIPDECKLPDIDFDAFNEEIEKFESSPFDYTVIMPMESRESFKIMEDFAEELYDSNPLKRKLFDALSRKRPFANFKWVIDNSGDYREKWFKFKDERMIQWVREQLESCEEM